MHFDEFEDGGGVVGWSEVGGGVEEGWGVGWSGVEEGWGWGGVGWGMLIPKPSRV